MLDLAFTLLGFLLGLKGLPFLLGITVRVIIAKNYIEIFSSLYNCRHNITPLHD